VQVAFEWQTIVSPVEANLGVSICLVSFQKLKIGYVQYRPHEDVATETTITVRFTTANRSKLITPFLHLVNEEVAAGDRNFMSHGLVLLLSVRCVALLYVGKYY
jgi:hypothetical protein